MRSKLRFVVPTLLALVALSTLGLGATAVSADEAMDATVVDDAADVRGAGFIDAEGDGIAFVGGRGTVRLLDGSGILWVKDFGGDATIDVSGFGRKTVFDDGWIQYAGVNGKATVSGSRIVVGVAGTGIDLHARGIGRVMLWGHGTCVIVTPAGTEEAKDWNGGFMKWHRFGSGSVDVAPAL
jgi:hypothetical protein